jgi:hypothetical protein
VKPTAGGELARKLRRRRLQPGDVRHLDEAMRFLMRTYGGLSQFTSVLSRRAAGESALKPSPTILLDSASIMAPGMLMTPFRMMRRGLHGHPPPFITPSRAGGGPNGKKCMS